MLFAIGFCRIALRVLACGISLKGDGGVVLVLLDIAMAICIAYKRFCIAYKRICIAYRRICLIFFFLFGERDTLGIVITIGAICNGFLYDSSAGSGSGRGTAVWEKFIWHDYLQGRRHVCKRNV